MIYYNPLDRFYKSILGAVKCEEEITFRVKGNFGSVVFVMHKDGEDFDTNIQLDKKDGYFEMTTSFKERGLYFYRFLIDGRILSKNDDYVGEFLEEIKDFQLSIIDRDYCVPNYLKGGIIYQIFPDRFYCSNKTENTLNRYIHQNKNEKPIYSPNEKGEVLNNDFFGGDFEGIIEKLDYIKSLGVNAIYLNPIFLAYSNHRYDTANYMEIDPLLGGEEDFKNLIKCADEKGIKIILDGVFNHTGADSIYFNKYGNYNSIGAYQSKNSPYYKWFNFIKYPNEYSSWWGIKTLPAVNKNNEDYISYITGENGVIDKYMNMGIGGFRLDVVDELPAHFVEKIREAVKRVNKDAIIIGEVWEDASNKIAYDVRRKYFLGKELDSVMNYPLKNAIIDFSINGNSKELSNTIKMLIDHYPKCVLDSLMNILSTHDTKRIISALSNIDDSNLNKDEKAELTLSNEQLDLSIKRLKIATTIQYTVCGVPSIYYGDEIGMQGFFDPYNRCYFDWDNINEDLLNWFKKLGEIRNRYSCFVEGDFAEIYNDNGIYSFIRSDNKSEALIVINNSKNNCVVNFSGTLYNEIDQKEYSEKMEISPLDSAILVNRK